MVALSWRETEVSSTQSWIREMVMCVTLEKLTYAIRGKVQEFEEVWTPLMDFLRQQ